MTDATDKPADAAGPPPILTDELLAGAAAAAHGRVEGAGTPDEHEEKQAFMSVSVGGALLALPAEVVEAVAALQAPVPIPLAPPHLRGFVLLGERAVVALDVAALAGLGGDAVRPRGESGLSLERLVVIRHAGMEVGLICERALGVRHFASSALRDPQVMKSSGLRAMLVAEVETEEGVVGVLDVARLLESARMRAEE